MRMKEFRGVIIEESLRDKTVLRSVKIVSTRIERVTLRHHTPSLKQWTLHNVEIDEKRASEVARKLGESLEDKWYADFDNEREHYIVFPHRIFKIDMREQWQYDEARDYGISLGIPKHQVDFHPKVRKWER